MTVEERISAFDILGNLLEELSPKMNFNRWQKDARLENPWFTEANVRMAINGVQKLLQPG